MDWRLLIWLNWRAQGSLRRLSILCVEGKRLSLAVERLHLSLVAVDVLIRKHAHLRVLGTLVKRVLVLHEKVILLIVAIKDLALEFVPISLISLLFSLFIEFSKVFVPTLLPKALESVELIVSNFAIIVASE